MAKLRWILLPLVLMARAATADNIILESYIGPRPSDAARILSPAIDELAKRKYVSGADVVGRMYEAVSTPAIVGSGLPRNFAQRVTDGHNAYVTGNFAEAVNILSPLVE